MLKAQIRKRLGELSLSIDLSVAKGITVLRGESGSGKTTIANLLSGALKPDEGEIELEGRSVFSTARSINLAPEARGIGFVFQTARLLPHLSVEENIRFPQTAGRRRPRVDFAEVVEILGLERLLHRHPGSLSGGEGQRVALARALMGTESLLILDEPLSSLDPERRSLLMGVPHKRSMFRFFISPILKRRCGGSPDAHFFFNLAVCEKWISARPLPIIRGVYRQ